MNFRTQPFVRSPRCSGCTIPPFPDSNACAAISAFHWASGLPAYQLTHSHRGTSTTYMPPVNRRIIAVLLQLPRQLIANVHCCGARHQPWWCNPPLGVSLPPPRAADRGPPVSPSAAATPLTRVGKTTALRPSMGIKAAPSLTDPANMRRQPLGAAAPAKAWRHHHQRRPQEPIRDPNTTTSHRTCNRPGVRQPHQGPSWPP